MAMGNRKMNVKRSNPGDKSQFGVLNQRMMNRLQAIKLREELESRSKGRPKRTRKERMGLERKKRRFAKGAKMAMMGGGKVMNPGMMALKKKAPEVAKRMGYMYGGKVKKMMGGGKVMKYAHGGNNKSSSFKKGCDGIITKGGTRGTIVT